MVRCLGIKLKDGERCNRSVKKSDSNVWYCFNHNKQKIGECCICYDDVNYKNDALFDCSHLIHKSCAKKLRDDTCPMCRKEINSKRLSSKELDVIRKRKMEDKKEREGELEDIDSEVNTDLFISLIGSEGFYTITYLLSEIEDVANEMTYTDLIGFLKDGFIDIVSDFHLIHLLFIRVNLIMILSSAYPSKFEDGSIRNDVESILGFEPDE